ncbi:hypothetical protein ASG40_04310 [Methylobacterium sp. Leaf399]|uniref:hypothetical protein n=1 Tax=Methylobacterium sp. Leaf399 TaxID=1736364 RepID=UPI0006FE2683|nr:hypothetical protein [Methylobacterium sp. Leaf399]KQT20024.1 hypothetical protein ASG40_04310 [Methylobacterium sp. Leaf399]
MTDSHKTNSHKTEPHTTDASLRRRAIRLVTAAYRRATLGPVPRLFDAVFYERTYPDVVASGLDPYLHFVRSGAAADRNPSADFDTAYYRDQSGPTALDPVRHYMSLGVKAGFDPSPAFSTVAYLARYPDVARAGANPLLHFRTDGRAERRIASPSLARPLDAVFLRGVPEGRQWAYPNARIPRFCLSLLRNAPVAACTQAAARICLLLTLDGSEVDVLTHNLAAFADSALDSLAIEIDMRLRLHPPNPTLALTLESCFHGARDADGTTLVRYAEARLWDLAPDIPRLKASFPPGCLAVRELA